MGRVAPAFAAITLGIVIVTSALPARAAAPAPLPYAALGDSYASGNGSGNEDGTSCRRSANAYSGVFARGSGNRFALADFAACSGANIAAVERSQLGGLGPMRLVSVTVGGNDARFGEIVVDCLSPWRGCRSDYPDEDQRIDSLEGPLHRLYGEIVAAAPGAQLLVLTYPQIVRQDTTCESTWTLTREDVDWFRTEYSHMNAVIRRAAAGVERTRVVDVENAFAGHELCTPQEWAFGGRWRDPYTSFHPNALGHASEASFLRAATP
ncbi:MAG TPA: SGNH/GDSL hydrolase family protein [Candidatus Dormibacteraeota bacterium]